MGEAWTGAVLPGRDPPDGRSRGSWCDARVQDADAAFRAGDASDLAAALVRCRRRRPFPRDPAGRDKDADVDPGRRRYQLARRAASIGTRSLTSPCMSAAMIEGVHSERRRIC